MSSLKCPQCGIVNWSTTSICKRCGAALIGSSAAAPPQLRDNRYPRARLTHEAKPGETIKSCRHCGKELALKKWDSWNGFLVQCPHCGGLHGKRWDIRRLSFASFLFNAFSFLFTMRPPKGVVALTAFIIIAAAGNYYLLDSEAVPDSLEIAVAAVLVLGPMLVNGILLVQHERDLDNSAPPTQSPRNRLAKLTSSGSVELGEAVVEFVEVLSVHDVDRHRSTQSGKLTGTRIRNDCDD